MVIPDFDERGLLPPGDHSATLTELRVSPLVDNARTGWDKAWRLHLVNQVEILANQLWAVGIREVVLDGSFVEDKAHPNDIDGYFTCDAASLGELTRQLNALDPHKVWTWDPATRKPYKGHVNRALTYLENRRPEQNAS
jgi:hypothetical protein